MRKWAIVLCLMCSTASCAASSAAAAATIAEELTASDKELKKLLEQQQAAVDRRQGEWLKAYSVFSKAREEAQTRQSELKNARDLFSQLSRDESEYREFVQAEQARLNEAIAARDAALAKAQRAHAEFAALFSQFTANLDRSPTSVREEFKTEATAALLRESQAPWLVTGVDPAPGATAAASVPAPGATTPAVSPSVATPAPQYASMSETPQERDCNLNYAVDMALRGPHYCNYAGGLRRNDPILPAMHFLFGDRSFNTQITSSAASTIAEIKINNESFYPYTPWMRRPTEARLFSREPIALGWSLGFKSESGRVFRFEHRDDDETPERELERVGYLDRLDSSLTATLGIGFGIFPRESGEEFLARATEMRDAARAACLQDIQKRKPAQPSTCENADLTKWIFAPKGRKYSNPDQIKAFHDLFYGSKYPRPIWGGGLQLEVARPKISYFPFALVEVPDPFDTGSTKKVVDPNNLPPEFLTNDPIEERRVSTAVKAHLFRHFRDTDADDEDRFNHAGTTIIPSLTWKRDYAYPNGTQGVRVCPPPDEASPIVTDQLCRTVNIADAKRKDTYIGGIELRTVFDFPWLVPQVGFAPKFTWEFKDGRKAAAFPLLFALDSKGILSGGLKYTVEFDGVNAAGKSIDPVSELAILVGASFDLHGNK